MAVKVQIGGSLFSCDTPEEAVRIHRLAGGAVDAPADFPVTRAPKSKSDGQGVAFTRKLQPYVGQEMSSDELAKLVGAADRTGLGPKMRQLRTSLANDALELDDYIRKHKPNATTPTTWRIVRAAS